MVHTECLSNGQHCDSAGQRLSALEMRIAGRPLEVNLGLDVLRHLPRARPDRQRLRTLPAIRSQSGAWRLSHAEGAGRDTQRVRSGLHGEQRAGPGARAMAVRAHELGFSRPCRPGSHVAAARVGRFGWVAMIGTVLWSGVRYACADDGVTIA